MLKLNDLLFEIKSNLEMYYYTSNEKFLKDANAKYKKYKNRNGKKVIEILEQLEEI